MPRPPKTAEERRATRSAANRRYYERHRPAIIASRAARNVPAPERWLALRYHPDLAEFVHSITALRLHERLYRPELEALMEVIELISSRWETSELADEEFDDYEERLIRLV